jgi:hypothetical protein
MLNLDRDVAAQFTSPIGRGIGRLWRPFLKRTPKRSFGYVASSDAIRVRGYALSWDLIALTRAFGATSPRWGEVDGSLHRTISGCQ